MVTETKKNGVLKLIVTSKEPHFYADSKYISFIKKLFIKVCPLFNGLFFTLKLFFFLKLSCETESNFSVKTKALRREQPLS